MRPPEQIEMHAHKGKCRYCVDVEGDPGIVKMWRKEDTFELMPDKCSCLLCGQLYFVVTDDIKKWEEQQWQEKGEP